LYRSRGEVNIKKINGEKGGGKEDEGKLKIKK